MEPKTMNSSEGGVWVREPQSLPTIFPHFYDAEARCTPDAPCDECAALHSVRHLDLPATLHKMAACTDQDDHARADQVLAGLALALGDRLGDTAIVEQIVSAYARCPKWFE